MSRLLRFALLATLVAAAVPGAARPQGLPTLRVTGIAVRSGYWTVVWFPPSTYRVNSAKVIAIPSMIDFADWAMPPK